MFTRRERVLLDGSAPPAVFGRLLVSESQLEWKTSDWIIQEVGLAVERDMKVIAFVEEGVRRPGGLTGDIEYIDFSRSNPHPSFDKLLQMLGNMRPKAAISASTPEITAPPQEKEEVGNPSESDDLEPSASWDQDRYDRALASAIFFHKGEDHFKRIDLAYRASCLVQGDTLDIWEGKIEYFRMISWQPFELEKLKRLSAAHPDNALLLFYIANGYEHFKEHEIAARTFEEAAARATTSENKVSYLGWAANQYADAGMMPRAREIAENLRIEAAGDASLNVHVLPILRDLAKAENENDFRLAAMEQMVELDPSDVTLRFALAYDHSEFGNSDMALHHYLKIPPAQRDLTTWNNLGVSYGDIAMPVRAVRAWRESAKEKNTLAMSNLGYKFLSAGFFVEAEKEGKRSACNQ